MVKKPGQKPKTSKFPIIEISAQFCALQCLSGGPPNVHKSALLRFFWYWLRIFSATDQANYFAAGCFFQKLTLHFWDLPLYKPRFFFNDFFVDFQNFKKPKKTRSQIRKPSTEGPQTDPQKSRRTGLLEGAKPSFFEVPRCVRLAAQKCSHSTLRGPLFGRQVGVKNVISWFFSCFLLIFGGLSLSKGIFLENREKSKNGIFGTFCKPSSLCLVENFWSKTVTFFEHPKGLTTRNGPSSLWRKNRLFIFWALFWTFFGRSELGLLLGSNFPKIN